MRTSPSINVYASADLRFKQAPAADTRQVHSVKEDDNMAVTFQRNVGMLLLGIWLVLYGLAGMTTLVLPSPLMAVLALLAGILILVGR
jgi:hypothetical protein